MSKTSKYLFLINYIQITNCSEKKKIKNNSTTLMKEIQIKTTTKYHLIPVTITIIIPTKDNKCWPE